jgi:hypothetical protein
VRMPTLPGTQALYLGNARTMLPRKMSIKAKEGWIWGVHAEHLASTKRPIFGSLTEPHTGTSTCRSRRLGARRVVAEIFG